MRTMPLLMCLLTACGGPALPDPVDPAVATAIAITPALPLAEIAVPKDSRDGRDVPRAIPLVNGWRVASSRGTTTVYQTPLPIRARSLFFSTPPPGMSVRRADDTVVPHRSAAPDTALRWTYDADFLRVEVPDGQTLPDDLSLVYPRATARERALNFAWSGASSPASFLFTSVQSGPDARSGLLLPAPAVAAWTLTVPPGGELRFSSGLVAPEVADGPPSDGASLVVEVDDDAGTHVVATESLRVGDFHDHRYDLSQWSGQQVRVRLRSEAGATSAFDYVFVGDPVLSSRSRAPRRMVAVFIDTLRPDHLGLYGYGRDTSPTLDAIGASGVVFEQARSVAPWTLPSTRGVLTGRSPEWYEQAETVQGRLRDAGWATAMFAGNVFLSANFDFQRDWGLHHVVNWPSAKEEVDDTLSWLKTQEGRDAFVMVHFMDAHLPYQEPRSHRYLFAGAPAGGLGEEFHRGDVVRAPTDDEAVRAYIEGRYDNTIRYINDELARLVDALGPDDTLLVFADHGEEFWDHGGFEHGHTLYDELLHVPLILRTQGLSGRVTAPVSLLDITPTLLDIAGLPSGGLEGTSLLPAARGDEGALSTLAARDQAFGRPLYGDTRWGVLHDGHKWTTTQGDQDLFDLATDPGERRDLAQSDPESVRPYPGFLGEALHTAVRPVLRVVASASRARPQHDLVLNLTVPGGVDRAWPADDPTNKSSAGVTVDGEHVTVTWHRGFRGSREVFVAPHADARRVALTVTAAIAGEGDAETPLARGHRPARPGFRPPALLAGRAQGRRLEVSLAIGPEPAWEPGAIVGYDPELGAMLQAMGYAVGNEAH